ncbi:hypothetical protein GCM10028895_16040 [Pontibacter rugosus]
MKKSFIPILLLAVVGVVVFLSSFNSQQQQQDPTAKRIEELLAKMTLEEKVGQLNFVVGDLFNTGPTVRTSESDVFNEAIKKGR